MSQKNLKKWATENPSLNPFTTCLNINTYGGADLFWNEFLYRYGERDIFDEDNFVFAVKRVFVINEYKFERLYNTTVAPYNIFTNYKVEKKGSETNTINMTKTGSGQDARTPNLTVTRTPNLTETTTPNLSQNETFTPSVKTKETITPTVKTKETVTPTVKTKETTTQGVSITTTSTPDSYEQTTSRTTYDNLTVAPVEKVTHTGQTGGTSVVTPTGNNTNINEVMSGDTQTVNEVLSGNTEKVTETLSGTNSTVTTKSGTSTVASTGNETSKTTGTDTTSHSSSEQNGGTEVLSFTGRTDEGYMYREPQNAIRDERDIARFALVNDILEDVERATLLSIY